MLVDRLTLALHIASSDATRDCVVWQSTELAKTAMTPQPVVMAKVTPKIYFSLYIEPLNMRRANEMTDSLAR